MARRASPIDVAFLAEICRENRDDLSKVFRIGDIAKARRGNNGTRWANFQARGPKGWQPLVLRFVDEKVYGRIAARTEDGAAEQNAAGDAAYPIKPRGIRPPSVRVRQYDGMVETLADGYTLAQDAAGSPVLPDCRSNLYEVCAAAAAYFQTTICDLKARGLISDSGSVAPGGIGVTNSRVALPVQTHVSHTNGGADAGKALPNPFVRLRFRVKKDGSGSGVLVGKLYDGAKRSVDAVGRNLCEPLCCPETGAPANNDNIHRCILSGSTVTGIVRFDSVCFSSMGISMPSTMDIAVVTAPEPRGYGIADLLGPVANSAGAAAGPPASLSPEAAARADRAAAAAHGSAAALAANGSATTEAAGLTEEDELLAALT